jgi:hypothetical protein
MEESFTMSSSCMFMNIQTTCGDQMNRDVAVAVTADRHMSLECYCQNSTGVVFSREEVWEYHPIWTTPRGIAHLRVGCEFHSWWYFKLNIPPKNCRDKARATPPKFHSCYDCKKRTRAYVQSSPN